MKGIIAFIMVLASLVSVAQETKKKKSIEEKSVEMVNDFSKTVELEQEQYEKIKLIYLDYLIKKKELSNRVKELEGEKKELKQERNKKVEELLNIEQKKKLASQKAKKKKRNKKN